MFHANRVIKTEIIKNFGKFFKWFPFQEINTHLSSISKHKIFRFEVIFCIIGLIRMSHQILHSMSNLKILGSVANTVIDRLQLQMLGITPIFHRSITLFLVVFLIKVTEPNKNRTTHIR